MQISHQFRLRQPAQRIPQALVVLLHDETCSAAQMSLVAERWATSLPETAFEAFETSGRGAGASYAGGLDEEIESGVRALEPILQALLRVRRLDPSSLVVVGFGKSGTLALQAALRLSWNCAGVLAIESSLRRPLPDLDRTGLKIRLIQCSQAEQGVSLRLRDEVAALAELGVDARGAAVTGPALSDEAVRHAGAYLVELVANAQRGTPARVCADLALARVASGFPERAGQD